MGSADIVYWAVYIVDCPVDIVDCAVDIVDGPIYFVNWAVDIVDCTVGLSEVCSIIFFRDHCSCQLHQISLYYLIFYLPVPSAVWQFQ